MGCDPGPDDTILGKAGTDFLFGGFGDDVIKGGGQADAVIGSQGNDRLSGGGGDDTVLGGSGADVALGGGGADYLGGGGGCDTLKGGKGADVFFGASGSDLLMGEDGNDSMEGGKGKDTLSGGAGDDLLLAMSRGGEPDPDQAPGECVNADEPMADRDLLIGGAGADRFEFRWLIDAKQEILDKHTNEDGDIDYSMNGVDGENDNVHDHWVETIGVKVVKDYDPTEGDTLVFKGHTVELDTLSYRDFDDDGKRDTVMTFVSNQGGSGAHDGDQVGTIVLLDAIIAISEVNVNAGVHFGVEDPYSAGG